MLPASEVTWAVKSVTGKKRGKGMRVEIGDLALNAKVTHLPLKEAAWAGMSERCWESASEAGEEK